MIIAQIHNKYKELTDTEQKVASFILSQPEAVTGMTAKELSEQCGTVPSAIIRFCKSIGTDGFSELKILPSELPWIKTYLPEEKIFLSHLGMGANMFYLPRITLWK